MKSRFHVVTPFSRSENFTPLANMLYREGAASWTLLLRDGETVAVKEPPPMAAMDWLKIRSLNVAVPSAIHAGLMLILAYVQGTEFVPEDRYIFLCDDDWIEPGFFEKLDDQTAPVIVVGMLRGQHTPTHPGHPTWPLIPSPQSMHYGFAGFEQGILRGHVINELRGIVPDMLARFLPNEDLLFRAARQFETAYVPGVNIWFNYLEPGRWDK